MRPIKKFLLSFALLFFCFIYGLGVGLYKWFPYAPLKFVQDSITISLSSEPTNEESLLKISKNKYPIFLEIKPFLRKELLSKLINETKNFNKVVFISFKKENIYKLLKINSNAKVGLSFSNRSSIKSIIKRSSNTKIKYLMGK